MPERNISSAFWTDPKIRALPGDARYLFLYLITNDHAHISGVYHLPTSTIADETDLSPERAAAALAALAGLVEYDSETREVWVVNMLRRQPGRSGTVRRSVEKHLRDIHSRKLLQRFGEAYGIPIPYGDTLALYPSGTGTGTGTGKSVVVPASSRLRPSCAPRPNGAQSEAPLGDSALTFERFYGEYPRKANRRAAERAWIRLSATDRKAALVGLNRFRRCVWLGKDREFIPHPASWLNARRWEDEMPAAPETRGDEIKRQREERGRATAAKVEAWVKSGRVDGNDGHGDGEGA